MPSFLTKVFGRKKGDERDSPTPRVAKRISDLSLLEGKFEAISPSTPKFPDDTLALGKGRDKEGDKGGPFGLLRSKSRPQPASPTTDAPHLTLRLPGTVDRNGGSLVASFDPQANGTDDSILTRRLTPVETLSLIEACSKAITERGGLETLGVMRPHWHSASPQLQRKLISLFILSLAQKSPGTTLAPSTSPSAAFNSELEYTRSVHDIAAVFRWALRHLKLEGASFGSSPSSDEWAWYSSFCEAERRSTYDPRVFTAKLVPEIPSTHIALLMSTLDIISSLAAHAEANGYSGSKLAKYFGFWLLTARRDAGTEDWNSFYTRWEVSGRILEHLFLSWLRDENTKRPLPRRLQELVAQYPYTTSPDPTVDGLLTRPRFSTRRHDALFVRVEAVYPNTVQIRSPRSPVSIFTDALKSEPKSDSGRHVYLWDQVKAVATSDPDDKPLPAILSDDTINLLSLVSTDPNEQSLLGASGAASTLATPLSPMTDTFLSPSTNGSVRKSTPPSSTPQIPKDWAEFSSAGFGETTISQNFASILLDKDVEVTQPPVQRKSSRRKLTKSTTTSVEFNPPDSKQKVAPEEPEGPKLILAATEVVQLDEAFIDFWRDAVADPVSNDWPKFVIGELKHPLTPRSLSSEDGGASSTTPISWIVIEEKVRRPTPPPTPVISHEALPTSGGLKVAAIPSKRSSSPRPSFGEKKSSLSATFKRFTLFGSSKDDLTEDINPAAGGSGKRDSLGGKKKVGAGKSPKIGELGEVLSEEPEPLPEVPKKVEKVEQSGEGKSTVATVAAGVVGGAAVGAILAATSDVDEGKVEAVKDAPPREGTKEEVTTEATTEDNEPPAPQDDSPVVEGKDEVPVASVPVPLASIPEVPPVVKETEAPVVGAELETLPSAPESVVSHGETPGPQLALDSTEVGLHPVPESATHVEQPQEFIAQLTDVPPVDDAEAADFSIPLSEPTIEHLEDKVEDPAVDVGVDLDPVPIATNDPVEFVEVEEVEEPEPEPVEVSQPPVTVDEKIEESAVQEDVPVNGVPAIETPAPVLEQEPEPEPTPIQLIVEDEDDVLAPPVEEPQPVVTEDVSSLPPNVLDDPVPQPTDTEPHPPAEGPAEVRETV